MKHFPKLKNILFKNPNILLSLPGKDKKGILGVFKDNNIKMLFY